jgi:hypothetical protein
VIGAHLRPVGIELLGDQCRHAGERSLAELDVLAEHRNRVVGLDDQEGVRSDIGRRRGRCLREDPALFAI